MSPDLRSICLAEWDRFVSPGFLSGGSSSLTACQRSLERSGITDVRRRAMDQPVTAAEHKEKVQDGDREERRGEVWQNEVTQREEDRGVQYVCLDVCMERWQMMWHMFVCAHKKVHECVTQSSQGSWKSLFMSETVWILMIFKVYLSGIRKGMMEDYCCPAAKAHSLPLVVLFSITHRFRALIYIYKKMRL